MFDVGFSELLVIGIVALVVIGPEDLPRVARTAGHLLGKLRRYVADVKSDIGREMEAADVKRLYDDVQASAQALKQTVEDEVRTLDGGVRTALGEVRDEVNAALSMPADLLAPPPAETPVVSQQEVAGHEAVSVPVIAEHEHDPNQLDLFGMPIVSAPARKE